MQITGDTLISDLLKQLPSTRSILDKYGLKGCGGVDGPHEPLRVFARAHDVPLQTLLAEVELQKDEPAPQPTKPEPGDVIYRRFFIAAIIFLLTAGATWGAHILAKIGMHKSFGAASVFDIQAHAQAQVFGWMGLVIMGFAYQAFPRFWHSALASARVANLSFWCMVCGIILAAAGLYTAPTHTAGMPLAMMGGTLELSAIALFFAEIFRTYRNSGKKLEPYIAFVFTALGWFFAGGILNLIHMWLLITGAASAISIDSAMRDIQFHGLGLTMILGVSLRTLPHIFGAQQARDDFSWAALVAITAAVILEVLAPQAAVLASGILLAVALGTIGEFQMNEKFADGDRSEKFIKAAWLWLVVSLAMLIVYPSFLLAAHLSESHAWIGSSRHAITVGFISLMIMGYAAKVVATLNGRDVQKLTNLLVPFVLVNVGCAIRVIGQSLTDIVPSAFPVMAVSGVLETTGLAIWGWHIASLMRASGQPSTETKSCVPRPPIVEADHTVADVVTWYPQLIPIFQEFGFSAIANPVLVQTVAKHVTLRKACRMHNIPLDDFIAVLNDTIVSTRCTGCAGTGSCGD